MPGKGDYGKALSDPKPQGQYFPGSNEWRAWDEGYLYRQGGTAAERPASNNPYTQTARPAEYAAWDAGHATASAATATSVFMPYKKGAAPT